MPSWPTSRTRSERSGGEAGSGASVSHVETALLGGVPSIPMNEGTPSKPRTDATKPEPESWSRLLAPRVIIVGLTLALVGSGLWDFAFKPGAVWGGRIFVDLISLGSTKIVDSIYQQAASDPTTLPALQGQSIILMALVAAVLMLNLTLWRFLDRG